MDYNNPFHREYNKVMDNPVHSERRLSLGTLSSEEPMGVVRLPTADEQWSFGGNSLSHSRETVNTAIVDFYQSESGGDEPVLRTRVSLVVVG